MTSSLNRFSSRVNTYDRYRPRYPESLIGLLDAECGLTKEAVIADVGSGTGILAELFLINGNLVFGIEPNGPMRSAAERLLTPYPKFISIDGTAESTNLDGSSVDFITAAQAFHWFQRDLAQSEFARIIRPGGWVVLIWNERRLDSTPFLSDYEALLLRYGTDYQIVRHENVAEHIGDFFAPQDVKHKSFETVQTFDFEGLKGRVRSSSYTPEPGTVTYEPMMARLEEIFEAHQNQGYVSFEYETKVYYGQFNTD